LAELPKEPVILVLRISDETSNMLIFRQKTEILTKLGSYHFDYSFPLQLFANVGIVVRAQVETYETDLETNGKLIAFTNDENLARFKISKAANKGIKGLLFPSVENVGDWR